MSYTLTAPCRLGQVAYYIHENKILKFYVVRISFERSKSCHELELWHYHKHGALIHKTIFSEIGKTVFLTKKEAEKALEAGK